MFVSLRLRLFSSASAAGSGNGGNYTIQQAGRDLARTVRQKAHLPFRPVGGAGSGDGGNSASVQQPAIYEFGSEFCKAFDARKLQKDLLQRQVNEKLSKDRNNLDQLVSETWSPSRYVQEIVDEAGYLPPVGSQTDETGKDSEAQQEEEPFWEKNKRAAAIAASHKPVELIKTGKEIHFMNGFFLSRFISDGGKMLPRWKTGLNARQQRKVAHEVRKARQLGIIPIMQKFLPSFEANLPGQALSNPLAGVWKPSPFRKREASTREEGGYLTREQISELMKQVHEEIDAEKEFQPEIKFGLPEVDQLKTERELIQFILSIKKHIPEIYSLNRLKFRAADAAVHKMTPDEVKEFLAARGAETSDCTKDEHLKFRARQYLNAFEEHIFRDSKVYNSIRFSGDKMRLFAKQSPYASAAGAHYSSATRSNVPPKGADA